MQETVQITRWPADRPPTKEDLLRLYAQKGMQPYSWSNAPGDTYGAHVHSYHKVIYVMRGSITFGLPEGDAEVTLHPGDRLDLPPGVLHNAVVGPEGVVCLEGHRREDTGPQ